MRLQDWECNENGSVPNNQVVTADIHVKGSCLSAISSVVYGPTGTK